MTIDRNLPLKFGPNGFGNSLDIPDIEQISPGQMLSGQMSLLSLESGLDVQVRFKVVLRMI